MLLAACGGEAGDGPPAEGGAPPASQPETPPAAAPEPAPSAPTTAPATYRVRFETNEGPFVVEVDRSLAPNGADRFYQLVSDGFYTDVRFFRVIPGFMAQFGINGDPAMTARYTGNTIQDDPVVGSNTRGTITFAMTSQPNSRGTQLFINLVDNVNLDASGFAPIGRVVEGMDVVDRLYSGYGEGAPRGAGPDQAQIRSQGNAYLTQNFPQLDYIERATIVQ
jgi:peptidyl-prolyl cis-trans isomerase A (cyclophilin A)